MVDSGFRVMKDTSKKEKIERIIRAKAKGISDEHVEQIIEAMNLKYQYAIVCSYDMSTFLNNAHNEVGVAFRVTVTPIYGDLTPGFVNEESDYEKPSATNEPCAFLKTAVIRHNGKTYHENSVFIYEVKPERNKTDLHS